jgi:hypothetical protein
MADPIPFDFPSDVFTAVVEALEAAGQEFESLAEPEVTDAMVPDSWLKTAKEHAALVAVIKRISYGSPEKRARLAAMYAEELAKVTPAPPDLGSVPVDRRAVIVDHATRSLGRISARIAIAASVVHVLPTT